MIRKPSLLILPILALQLGVSLPTPAADGPLSPDEATRSFEFEPGLRVELVAAEPFTADPCALAWEERGRLFVAENRGYPLGGPGGQAMGVVALLEDTNGDGRIDKRNEFATGLTYPNGVLPWRGGLIVTCAPDVFYLKDTDGDGKADVREVILTGFATNQSTQLRVNAPMLAPDGWVYLASGLSGGRITSPRRPQQPPHDLKGDLRFNPDTGEFQHADGRSQFGQSFDDFGRRFGVFNRVQVQHFVAPAHYWTRNPRLNFGEVIQNCPELLPNPFMRGGGAAARIYPISANVTTADSHAGTFSAACAIHLYRSDALPPDYHGHAFSCDPTGNLVHHDRLEASGATFVARRARENTEFLRSRDNWFRPCFLATGPDGALYIADMYRQVIEHPEYLPEEVRKRTDFDGGKGMGRIWRVTAADARTVRASRPLPTTTRGLLRELDSPNAWRRDTAFRLLLEQNDRALIPALRKAVHGKASAAGTSARLHLLALLQGLDAETLLTVLRSPHPGVREVALQLAEVSLPRSPSVRAAVLKLAEAPEARVRFRAALSLGPAEDSAAIDAIAKIALQGSDDRWTRAAVLSAVPDRATHQLPLMTALLHAGPADDPGTTTLLRDLAQMIATATPEASLPSLLAMLIEQSGSSSFPIQASIAEGFARGVAASGKSGDEPALLRFAPEAAPKLFQVAQQVVLSPTDPLSRRLNAVQLLGYARADWAAPSLLSVLHTNAVSDLQMASVRALAELSGTSAVKSLLDAVVWRQFSPALREATLSSILSRPRHWPALLEALESGGIPVNALNSARRDQLRNAKTPELRTRAETLFASAKISDRTRAYEEARAALRLKPVPANGRQVFRRACANCHRLEGEGFAVGPDLFDIRNQPKESILLHIVIPEQEIAPNFANYTCETKDGEMVSGILVAETSAGITLRQALGVEQRVARTDIASLVASTLSLMPQELEKGMTAQELADLLAFLRGE